MSRKNEVYRVEGRCEGARNGKFYVNNQLQQYILDRQPPSTVYCRVDSQREALGTTELWKQISSLDFVTNTALRQDGILIDIPDLLDS